MRKDHRSTACGFCVRSIRLLAHVALVSATGLKRNSQTSSGCCLGWEGSHFLCVLASTGLGVYAQKLYRSHAWCWLWRCLALGATPCLLDNTHEIVKNSELLHFSFKRSLLRCELRVREQSRTGHCSLHSQLRSLHEKQSKNTLFCLEGAHKMRNMQQPTGGSNPTNLLTCPSDINTRSGIAVEGW